MPASSVSVNQKGFIPLAIVVLVMAIIAGTALYIQSQKLDDKSNSGSASGQDRSIPSMTPTIKTSSATGSASPKVSVKATIAPSSAAKTQTTAPKATTASTKTTPTSYSQSNYYAQSTYYSQSNYYSQGTYTPPVTCSINVDKSSGPAPLTVTFVYGASYAQSDGYVTDVQWDFNGDGSWDTSYDTSQQHPSPYTFSSPGSYNSKMHLKTQGGRESDVCSTTITVN